VELGNEYRNWQITNGGRTFKCEGQVDPGLAGALPWNWWNDYEWAWYEFDLNEHLNNVNGTLEFWAKKHVSAKPHPNKRSGFSQCLTAILFQGKHVPRLALVDTGDHRQG
jgi:hypothetical protein